MNKTKKQLSEAFWQLLETKQYNKITVQNIVELCQVNRNTFYYHFPDIPALAEYSICEWADNIIGLNYIPDSPINCLMPIAEECTTRKEACLHLYQSSHRDEFIRYLYRIIDHMLNSYVEQAKDNTGISSDDLNVLIHYYRCVYSGILLDWFKDGMSYDLPRFCNKIRVLYPNFGRNPINH